MHEESVVSYNMGFLGGTDLDFIHRYCQEVFGFMEKNRMNDPTCPHSTVDCNVFFEQVIFAMMADREHRTVASVLGRSMQDEGYTRGEFCDLDYYGEKPFYHILGGHKRSQAVCEMMSRSLLRIYPDCYWCIINLFPNNHFWLQPASSRTPISLSVEHCIAQYEDWLYQKGEEWKGIPPDEIFHQEQRIVMYRLLIEVDTERQNETLLERNSHFALFQIPVGWHPNAVKIMRNRLNFSTRIPHFDIVVRPTLHDNGLHEAAIGKLAYNIIVAIGEGNITFGELCQKLEECFTERIRQHPGKVRTLLIKEIEYMMYHGILLMKEEKEIEKNIYVYP